MSSVQRADPVARTWVLIALIAFVAVAVLGWREFSNWLLDLRSVPPAEAMRVLLLALRLLILGMGLSLVALALYLLSLGKRTRHAIRYPPPGARVIRDTVVLEGEEALVRGRLLQTTGYVLLLLAGAFVVVGNWFVSGVSKL
jgi:hypothetical protein